MKTNATTTQKQITKKTKHKTQIQITNLKNTTHCTKQFNNKTKTYITQKIKIIKI